jgi:iron complex transport system substrate-binding protein
VVRGLPRLTSSRIGAPPDLSEGSAAIDARVRRLAREALGVYTVELDALAAAAPDLIVTQDLCDVCAVSLSEVQRAVRAVLGEQVELVSLSPTRLADVWDDVRRVAAACGVSARGEALVDSLRTRVDAIAARAAATPERPPVLTLEWLEPTMLGGTWNPELVALAGGTPLGVGAGQHAPTVSADELRALRPPPDAGPWVCVVKPCGFTLEHTRAEAGTLRRVLARSGWLDGPGGRVYLADGNAYFNRPGPRLVESLEILAACIHPGPFADLGERHRESFERFPG